MLSPHFLPSHDEGRVPPPHGEARSMCSSVRYGHLLEIIRPEASLGSPITLESLFVSIERSPD